jgi:hypothetical protein
MGHIRPTLRQRREQNIPLEALLLWEWGAVENKPGEDVMTHFNPFNKKLNDIEGMDFQLLTTVGEGWYVEYKVKPPSTRAIAKSVAAFANHFGGWLFYGIEEGHDTAGNSVAASFPGFPNAEIPRLMDRVRDSIASHINPPPHFELRAVQGADDGPFPVDRSVIVVQVPEGLQPPYVHRSGRIYRRVGSSSDPKEESDRNVLDLLWEKGRRGASRIRQFIEENTEGIAAGSEKPFLHVIMLNQPLLNGVLDYDLGFNQFAEIMADGDPDSGGLSMPNVYTEERALVARLVGSNDPTWSLPLWRYFPDGSSIFSSPIASFRPMHTDGRFVAAKGKYKWLDSFVQMAQTRMKSNFRVLDLNHLLLTLGSAVGKHAALLHADQKPGRTKIALLVEGIDRMIPFFDAKQFMAYVDVHGFPVLLQERTSVPHDYSDLAAFLPVDLSGLEDAGETKDAILNAAGVVWTRMLQAMGVPAGIFRTTPEELVEAMLRARGAVSL